MANSLFRKKSIAQIQADAAAGLAHEELVPGAPGEETVTGLRRSLGTFDLTMLGIAAIIGAGIFAMVGNAANRGGPGVVLLFVFAAIACGFAALCYAEFASKIPIAGSAYTYAYASFGELLAWIIGWDLLVEYAIGNIAVAISWSDYFTSLLEANGINIPLHFTMDFRTAYLGFDAVSQGMAGGGATVESLRAACEAKDAVVSCAQLDAFEAWIGAPTLGGLPIVADLPALGIVVLITALVYIGIRESKTASNIMVAVKLAIILLVIILGAFYVNTANWSPFLPTVQAGSPFSTPTAYWRTVSTIRAAGYAVTPYHVHVPTFGDWGFVLARRGAGTPKPTVPRRAPTAVPRPAGARRRHGVRRRHAPADVGALDAGSPTHRRGHAARLPLSVGSGRPVGSSNGVLHSQISALSVRVTVHGGGSILEQPGETVLVENRHAEFDGLVELRPG